ncbi:BON domain-containing protein [Maritimibacter sp. DP1N21-5]|uniref:BON domain-containing protein n=1 Tax=Maritimibacter sp. DP1N21-5 TaxID=2836867 RepID=UPI001C45602F|nr:BON domain-containing protein [Maritimibacter sp. DP1N21-5]MBV7410084.1 BON domain-containing protein [Maritimibacter sp. DP1N21-5]
MNRRRTHHSGYTGDRDESYAREDQRRGFDEAAWGRGRRDNPDARFDAPYGREDYGDHFGEGAGYWEGERHPDRSRGWPSSTRDVYGRWGGDPFFGYPPTGPYRGNWADRTYGRRNQRRRDDDRDFLDRASDEVSSWFGDEDAERRREMDHRGRGPKSYQRSDSRIEEDVNDRLTDNARVDATEISVTVKDREVTLDGTVDSRGAKRAAEDCADSVSGVEHVQNNLRVQRDGSPSRTSATGRSS